MSEQEEFNIEVFEDFIGLYVSPFCQTPTEGYTLDDMRHSFNAGKESCCEQKDKVIEQLTNSANYWKAENLEANKVIEQQATELAALRGFAKAVVDGGFHNGNASVFGLIDKNGNPTALLTGEVE